MLRASIYLAEVPKRVAFSAAAMTSTVRVCVHET